MIPETRERRPTEKALGEDVDNPAEPKESTKRKKKTKVVTPLSATVPNSQTNRAEIDLTGDDSTGDKRSTPAARTVAHAPPAHPDVNAPIGAATPADPPRRSPTNSAVSLPPATTPPSYAHRRTLEGRAAINNAADSTYFKNNRALVFNFVEYSDVTEDDNSKLASCKLKCSLCNRGEWKWIKNAKGGGSTTNMNTHMKEKHSAIWVAAERADKKAAGVAVENMPQPTIGSMFQSKSFDIETFFEKLIKWLVISNQPFTEVECDEFQDLIIYLHPSLQGKLVKADQMRNKIVRTAVEYHERFKKIIEESPGLVPISCDAWTSSNRIAFLAITASWITEEWTMEEVLLDFVELHGAHSGENMGNAVLQTVKELEMSEKLLALASDSASNNGTLITSFSAAIRRLYPSSRWDGDKAHIRCLAHIIHLAVMELLINMKAIRPDTPLNDFQDHPMTEDEAESLVAEDNRELFEKDEEAKADAFVDLKSAIDKVRKISKIVRSSPQRMELFRTLAERVEDDLVLQSKSTHATYKKKKVKNLVLDVCTRWNSVYFMLERALEFREAIDALCEHPRVKIFSPYALSSSDWVIVDKLCGHHYLGLDQ